MTYNKKKLCVIKGTTTISTLDKCCDKKKKHKKYTKDKCYDSSDEESDRCKQPTKDDTCRTCVVCNDKGIVVTEGVKIDKSAKENAVGVGARVEANKKAKGSIVGVAVENASKCVEAHGLVFDNAESTNKDSVGAFIDAGPLGQALDITRGRISIPYVVIDKCSPQHIGPGASEDTCSNDSDDDNGQNTNATYYFFACDARRRYTFHFLGECFGDVYTFFNSSDHDIQLCFTGDGLNDQRLTITLKCGKPLRIIRILVQGKVVLAPF